MNILSSISQHNKGYQLFLLAQQLNSQNNVELLKCGGGSIEVIKQFKTKTLLNLSLYTTIDDQNGQFLVEINNRDQHIQTVVNKMGITNFFRIINELNSKQNCQYLFAWDENRDSILLRAHFPKMALDGQQNFAKICKAWNNFAEFLQSLLPKRQKQVWGSQHIKMKQDLTKNFQKWRKFIGLRKNYQSKSRQFAEQNRRGQVFCCKDLMKVQKKYTQNQQKTPYIFRSIKILQKLQNPQHSDNKGHYCNLLFHRYKYMIQNQMSINKQINQFLQKVGQKQAQNAKQQQVINGILAHKTPLRCDPLPFKVEKQIITYLRAQKSTNIASYYSQDADIQQLYMPKYNQALSENTWSRARIKISSGIAAGVYFLYSRQLLHRDLKPNNIMMDGLTPKIIDFGSASEIMDMSTLNLPQQNMLRSTRKYNMVWQALPREIKQLIHKEQYNKHPQFDVYALGKILDPILNNFYTKSHLGEFLLEHIVFLINKCVCMHPGQRLYPLEVLAFLDMLEKYQQKRLIVF